MPNGGSLNFTDTSWKVGVEFDLRDQSLLYANVRTGFKAGGFAPGLAPNTYKPEKLTAMRLGSKNRFFDNRLQANLEVFYWTTRTSRSACCTPSIPPVNPAGR
ncbi:MAG: TonB-dependent receptor [Vicinamibacterales bacterium]